jgi:hypothetical protein
VRRSPAIVIARATGRSDCLGTLGEIGLIGCCEYGLRALLREGDGNRAANAAAAAADHDDFFGGLYTRHAGISRASPRIDLTGVPVTIRKKSGEDT